MKRIVLYIVALTALAFVPVKGANIGSLHPVEVVLLKKEGEQIVISTDTEDEGKGNNALAALEDLKRTTPGTIYLDTAEYLLVTEETEAAAQELKPVLKRSVQICRADPKIELTKAAKYLPSHGRLPQLRAWSPGEELPYLTMIEERLKLS